VEDHPPLFSCSCADGVHRRQSTPNGMRGGMKAMAAKKKAAPKKKAKKK
jgi:hypothetical protein